MQQTMGDLKFLNKIAVLTVSVFLFIGCHPREPREPRLELQLKKQNAGEVFSFADYCEEEYDSIYLIHPYDDENVIWSLPYNMSKRLREKCCYTLNDTFVRILFIDNDTVKAYTQIGNWSAYFSTLEVIGSGPRYSFEQKFILDEKRYVHISKARN